MNFRYLILIFIGIFFFNSCEKELDFPQEDSKKLCIFALAFPQQEMEIYVSHSLPINSSISFMQYLSLNEFTDKAKEYYRKKLAINDANVRLKVNGEQEILMTFNDSTHSYRCDYTPRLHDRLSLIVAKEGYMTATAETYVEEPTNTKDFHYTVRYNEAVNQEDRKLVEGGQTDVFGMDSLITLTFSFHDSAFYDNYYRLKVRSVGDIPKIVGTTIIGYQYSYDDTFTSPDIIFHDGQLAKDDGGWEPYMTNVFDDHLFDGTDHTFTLDTRLTRGMNKRIILELQSISKDLYLYLKSMQIYERSSDDVFASPVSIYTNVRNGWGVFGSMSSYPQTIYLHR